MAELRTPKQVHDEIVTPLLTLTSDFSRVVQRWEKAVEAGDMSRADLLLNIKMAHNAVKQHLPRFLREVDGKVDDAINGVYRYRDSQNRQST